MIPSNVQIRQYTGGNHLIDSHIDSDDEVWIVNGTAGRKVLILPLGSTAADAWVIYSTRWLQDGAEDA